MSILRLEFCSLVLCFIGQFRGDDLVFLFYCCCDDSHLLG